MSKKLLYSLLMLSFTLFIIELLAYGTGLILQEKNYLYKASQAVTNENVKNYQEYLSKRDPVLGWPAPSQFGKDFFDLTGSRRIPAFEDPTKHQTCVSLYGESFTKAGEVDHAQAWSNLLSKLLNCRVANFGVGGYGTDQAYLRFKRNDQDKAKLVIFGYLSENIERNLTRDRDLLTFSQDYALKPRFILDESGHLKLIPLPELSESSYHQLLGLQSPQLELEHENFYPGGPAHTTLFQFPYTYALIKNTRYFRFRAKLAGRSWYAEFYTANHPFRGLEITTEIIKTFVNEANQKNKQPIILLFAMGEDLKFYRTTNHWTYENLMKALDANQIPYLNFGEHLLAQATDKKLFAPHGHYNEEGNRLLAEFVYAHLTKHFPNVANSPVH